ncbi:MAG: SMI1/KNR4 family protein [Bacteroidia bacterium]|jgi:hypothetical protein|nr:SMI1/KNR4 family protein [Bacteroidia bacterium]
MKCLTILNNQESKVQPSDIDYFEERYKIKIPEKLKDFFLLFGGSRIKEMYYHRGESLDQVCDILLVKSIQGKPSCESIYQGHLSYGDIGFIPFAIDSGGWDYNVSINPDTYGQVWVDKFDSGEETPFEFVCNSFEEFIDGLTEQEKDF